MRADELVPRRCLFSLRRGRYTVALQYVADGLVARSIPEVRHGPGNAIIAPRSVLSREADNQLFDLFVDSWSPRIRPVLGTVELPGDELAVPPENRIGPDDTRHLFERALAELFSDLRQGSPLTIGRFKDDYRILVKDESEGRRIVKALQAALREFDLELSDDKTSIHVLPEGLFRSWVSLYHAVHPRKRRYFRWKDFSELYLAVLRIDKQCPDTGVIDRFLADIVSNKGKLKLNVTRRNLQKAMSMLLMLGNRRVKAFPKVLAIIESILQSSAGAVHEKDILTYVDSYLRTLVKDEDRNQYLISWIASSICVSTSRLAKSSPECVPRYCQVFHGLTATPNE